MSDTKIKAISQNNTTVTTNQTRIITTLISQLN